MQDFKDKIAVITGAASGLGLEFARRGCELGMKLVLVDVQPEPLAAAERELRALGAEVMAEVVDVANGEHMRLLADRVFARFGAVHLLFNNAGVAGRSGLLWETTDRDWTWFLNVNVMGVVHGIQHFVPRMIAANALGQPGHIVNTASLTSWLCAPLKGLYAATKHAVLAISETLAHDLKVSGSTLGVSVLCPSFVPTNICDSERNRPPELRNEQALTASQELMQTVTKRALETSRVTAADVARMTFDGIRSKQQIIFTHPETTAGLRARYEFAQRGSFMQRQQPARSTRSTSATLSEV